MSLWKRLTNVARGALLLRRKPEEAIHPEVADLRPEPAPPSEPELAPQPEASPPRSEEREKVPPTPRKRRL